MIRMLQGLIQRLVASPTRKTAFTGYLALASTMVIGVVSVPIALKYLTSNEFGLWRIVGQSLGYLLLLDFGVSSAASRMLVGPLKAEDPKELNSWWTVLLGVLFLQSAVMFAIGWVFRDIILFRFFDIPPELHHEAVLLWGGMMAANAIQMPFRAYTGILLGQNRWYMMHVATVVSSWVNLLLFAVLLLTGMRTMAYLIASIASVACSTLLWWIAVRRSGIKLNFSLSLFEKDKLRALFGFSSGVFLMGLAAQLTYMSQGIVIAKVLGLGAVAAFVVSSSSVNIVIQFTRRGFEAYVPGWMQLFVEGERRLISDRWRSVMSWYLPLGVMGALGILIFNRSFSELYGGGAHNHEGRLFDLSRAIWLLLQVTLDAIHFPFPFSARVRAWSLFGLLDALMQLAFGVVLTHWMGPSGLIFGSVLGSLLVLVPFYVIRAPRELEVPIRVMLGGFGWKYAASLGVILLFYLLLGSQWSVAAGWWPTPMEFTLGAIVGFAFLLMVFRKRQLLAPARELPA